MIASNMYAEVRTKIGKRRNQGSSIGTAVSSYNFLGVVDVRNLWPAVHFRDIDCEVV